MLDSLESDGTNVCLIWGMHVVPGLLGSCTCCWQWANMPRLQLVGFELTAAQRDVCCFEDVCDSMLATTRDINHVAAVRKVNIVFVRPASTFPLRVTVKCGSE